MVNEFLNQILSLHFYKRYPLTLIPSYSFIKKKKIRSFFHVVYILIVRKVEWFKLICLPTMKCDLSLKLILELDLTIRSKSYQFLFQILRKLAI